jgi:tRNA nucleotidyltransferase (CCA-adding enzyme)
MAAHYTMPTKHQDGADWDMVVDTGDPFQNMANAIVQQAATDFMTAYRYIKDHPSPVRIESYLDGNQIQILNEPAHMTDHEKLVMMRTKKAFRDEVRWQTIYRVFDTTQRQIRVRHTPEYRAYIKAERAWVQAKESLDNCEAFFRGEWMKMLTALDGTELMGMLIKEVESA